MSAPTIVDSPIETKPLVNPEWVNRLSGSHELYYEKVSLSSDTAAEVRNTSFLARRHRPSDGRPGQLLLHDARNGRSLDECKRLCEQALRDAGYGFAGEASPCSNPACDCGDMRPDDRITLPTASGKSIPQAALDRISQMLSGGKLPLGHVEWTPAPEFVLHSPLDLADQVRSEAELLVDDADSIARWTEIAAVAVFAVGLLTNHCRGGKPDAPP